MSIRNMKRLPCGTRKWTTGKSIIPQKDLTQSRRSRRDLRVLLDWRDQPLNIPELLRVSETWILGISLTISCSLIWTCQREPQRTTKDSLPWKYNKPFRLSWEKIHELRVSQLAPWSTSMTVSWKRKPRLSQAPRAVLRLPPPLDPSQARDQSQPKRRKMK
mgnify:CR=1 FL=1